MKTNNISSWRSKVNLLLKSTDKCCGKSRERTAAHEANSACYIDLEATSGASISPEHRPCFPHFCLFSWLCKEKYKETRKWDLLSSEVSHEDASVSDDGSSWSRLDELPGIVNSFWWNLCPPASSHLRLSDSCLWWVAFYPDAQGLIKKVIRAERQCFSPAQRHKDRFYYRFINKLIVNYFSVTQNLIMMTFKEQ